MALALLDTNVLVHAVYRGSSLHDCAAGLVWEGLHGDGRYCITPQNLIEFAAVVSRKRFVDPPLEGAEITRMADLLFRSRRLAKIYPKRATVIRAVREGAALAITGPRWYDFFLALTMRDAGVEIIITDNVDDFQAIPFITALKIQEASST